MSHLYFHRIERGVEYFTFFGSTSFHISGCRWKYLPTQCFMPHITVSPARYLVQHHCNLFGNIVFFTDTFGDFKRKYVVKHRVISTFHSPETHFRTRFWDMTRCIKCFQPHFKWKITLVSCFH